MVKIKEMPYSERYSRVMNMLKLQESIQFPFIRKHLDNQALTELQKMEQEVIKPIREDISLEQKYEIAFTNWFLASNVLFNFVKNKLGEDGITRFVRLYVESLQQQNSGLRSRFSTSIRFVSPGTVFSTNAKKVAYQLQWLGSNSMVNTSKTEWLVDIPHCKILNYTNNEDICLIGCHKIYTMWVAEQFGLKLQYHRQGKNCAMTITPLK